MGSSRVPAKERKGGSNSTSGQNWKKERRRIASRLATTDKWAIARAFGRQ